MSEAQSFIVALVECHPLRERLFADGLLGNCRHEILLEAERASENVNLVFLKPRQNVEWASLDTGQGLKARLKTRMPILM